MATSQAARAGRALLVELSDPGPSTTERALVASNRDRFSRMDISLGLRWLKNRGWAEKDGGLASRARPDLGNAWRLTPDGQGEVDRLLAKRVAWEKAQAEVDH